MVASSTSSRLHWSFSGGCFAALFWWTLGHRRRLGDRFWRMLCRYGGSGGCFATLVVLPILAPLAL